MRNNYYYHLISSTSLSKLHFFRVFLKVPAVTKYTWNLRDTKLNTYLFSFFNPLFRLMVKGINSAVSSALKITIKSVKRIITTTKQPLVKWVCIVNVAFVELETFHTIKVITLKSSNWDNLAIKSGHYLLNICSTFWQNVCKPAPTLLLISVWIISRKSYRAGRRKQRVETNFVAQQAISQVCGETLKIAFSSY